MTETTDSYDVVIYELKSGRVDSVVGTDLAYATGYYNAVRRLDTAMGRINDRYNAAIVPAGRYAKGDKLNEDDVK